MDDDDLPPAEFDALQYIASNPDLILAFGVDEPAATKHYLQFGRAEGRPTDTFDERQYLTNYPDLQAVYGDTVDEAYAATTHFVEFGFREGRTDDALAATTAALDMLT